ncbi:MAG: hypothetical protein RR653_05280 [Clostridia bacterium]
MEYPHNHSETLVNPPIWDVEDLASATECTGLTPAAVQTQSEAESYARLYAIHEQKPVSEPEE